MTKARQRLGQAGEAVAARFLEARGYRIVARNVRADRVEMDLVARRGPLLVFIEVKSRASLRSGSAAEAVDARKQQRLRRGARAWLASKPVEARGTRRTRFDVVTCLRVRPDAALSRESQDSQASPRTSGAPRSSHVSGAVPFGSWAPNDTTAPGEARWWIEHWEAAF
jgi:putative endonuclease